MENPIEIENLVKDYHGGFRAVDSLTLKVPHKAFLGFLGPNGAGKTTSIKVLTNMLTATSGRASLNGIDVVTDPKRALADVGAVVETPEFYPYLTPIETLEYLGQLRGMSMEDIRRRSKEVLEVVKMTEWQDKRIGKFSKGMKQRLAIAQALLHEPSVIILDEPTSGLDPRGMFEMREVLKELKKGDYTIFMSSHLMNEVQEVCSDVALINRGKLLKTGSVESLLSEFRGKKIEVRTTHKVEPADFVTLGKLAGVQGINALGENAFTLDFDGGDDEQARLLLDLQAKGLKIVTFKESGMALESLYMSLIKDSR
jgi:ABC-2 type transport system ATP-binding protein